MTDQKKQYTNNDLWKKMDAMEGRLDTVERWQYDADYSKKIIADFVSQQNIDKAAQGKSDAYSLLKDAGPYILIILSGIAIVIYAYASRVK